MIFKYVKKIITGLFSTIYAILAFFNLQVTLLLALIGVVLYFTGVLTSNHTFSLVYEIILIASVVYAVVSTVRKLLGLGKDKKKPKRSSNAQIISTDGVGEKEEEKEEKVLVEEPAKRLEPVIEKPRYYRVKQSKDYIMAEYSDRYELFRITGEGLKKVRTDLK